MSNDDRELIQECLAGRTEAFGRLVVRYQDRLFGSLLRILDSHDDARDVAQEAFVLAYQKLASFKGNSAFYSWLFRIAMNAAVSHRRRSGRQMASVDQAREQSGSDPVDGHPESRPAHALELAERQALVNRALQEVSEEFRTVLVLKEIEDLSYEEIAEIVGIPIGTVRSRIHRARSELREKLDRLFRDD
ncbi:MAG: sigma-70 family RNA polymerase sigma factor [Planctomycetaceae bacterium]